jgi:hypothetical protein
VNWKLLAFFPLAGALLYFISRWTQGITVSLWMFVITPLLAIALSRAVRTRWFLHGLLAGSTFWAAYATLLVAMWLPIELGSDVPEPHASEHLAAMGRRLLRLLAICGVYGGLLGALTALFARVNWRKAERVAIWLISVSNGGRPHLHRR